MKYELFQSKIIFFPFLSEIYIFMYAIEVKLDTQQWFFLNAITWQTFDLIWIYWSIRFKSLGISPKKGYQSIQNFYTHTCSRARVHTCTHASLRSKEKKRMCSQFLNLGLRDGQTSRSLMVFLWFPINSRKKELSKSYLANFSEETCHEMNLSKTGMETIKETRKDFCPL